MRIIYLIIINSIISCDSNEPRYPVDYFKDENSTIVNQVIIEQNKKINNYISKNKKNIYLNSKKGFFYFFNKKNNLSNKKAEFGDIINFNYSVKDLNNKVIYDEEFIGDQSYVMGKQEIITGIREALQLLKKGETATFIFPSYKAYGIYGDNSKISPNTAIICTIKVKSINSIKI
jgi:gliding motility-associated peptidyl-prolyl isomerase